MMSEGGMWHVGRGGAGNYASGSPASERKDSTSSEDSNGSIRSVRSGGFLQRWTSRSSSTRS